MGASITPVPQGGEQQNAPLRGPSPTGSQVRQLRRQLLREQLLAEDEAERLPERKPSLVRLFGVPTPIPTPGAAVDAARRFTGGIVREGQRILLGQATADIVRPINKVVEETPWLRWFANTGPGAVLRGVEAVGEATERFQIPEERIADVFGAEDESEYILGNIAEDFGKLVPSLAAITIATGGAGSAPAIATQLGIRSAVAQAGVRLGVEGLRGAVAEGISFEATERLLADEELFPEWMQPVVGILAHDEDDSVWVSKFKQVTEGFLTNAAVDALIFSFRGFRSWKKLKSARKAGRPTAEQDLLADEALTHLEEAQAAFNRSDDLIRVVESTRRGGRLQGFEVHIDPSIQAQVVQEPALLQPETLTRTPATTKLSEAVPFDEFEVAFHDPDTGIRGTITGTAFEDEPGILSSFDIKAVDEKGVAIPHAEIKNKLGLKKIRQLGVELRGASGFSQVEGFRISGAITGPAARPGVDLTKVRDLPESKNAFYRTRGEAEAEAARIQFVLRRKNGLKGALTPDELQRVQSTYKELQGTDPRKWEQVLRNNRLNVNYGAGAEEGRALILSLAEAVPRDFVKTGKGKRAVNRLAANMFHNMEPEEVLTELAKRNVETADLDRLVIGMHHYFQGLGRDIDQLSRIANSTGDAALIEELGRALDHARGVAREMVGISSNAGRFLQAHKRLGMDISVLSPAARRILSPNDGPGAFAQMTKEEILTYGRKIQMAEGNPKDILAEARSVADEINDAVRETADPSLLDKFQEYQVNNMVSGPKTVETNILSGLTKITYEPLLMVKAGLGTGNAAQAREGADIIVGNFLSLRDGLRAFAKGIRNGEGGFFSRARQASGNVGEAFITGQPVRDPGAVPAAALAETKIKGLWGSFVNLARKPLVGGDELIKTIAGRSKVRARSLRLIRENPRIQSLPEKERALAIAKQVEADLAAHIDDRGRFTNMTAQDFARDATFTHTLGAETLGGRTAAYLKAVPALKTIHPFHRIGVQLFREAWALTPVVGKYAPQIRRALEAGGEEAAVAQAKMQFGSAVYALGGYLSLTGAISGGGPRNDALRKQWFKAGNKPYHITVGDNQYDLRRMWPFTAPLMLAADAVAVSDYLDEDQVKQVPLVIMAAIATSVTSPTFMRGLSEAMEAATGDIQAMDRFAESMSARLIPLASFVRSTNPDEIYRETNDIFENLIAQTPFSPLLEPDRNAFGEQIERPPGYLNRAFNVFSPSPLPDPLLNELVDLGRAIPRPSPFMADGRIDLRDRNKFSKNSSRPKGQSPFDRWQEIMGTRLVGGTTFREDVQRMVNSEQWQLLSSGTTLRPGGSRHLTISRMYEAKLAGARAVMLTEYPELQIEYAREVAKNAAALQGPEAVEEVEALIDHIYRR